MASKTVSLKSNVLFFFVIKFASPPSGSPPKKKEMKKNKNKNKTHTVSRLNQRLELLAISVPIWSLVDDSHEADPSQAPMGCIPLGCITYCWGVLYFPLAMISPSFVF